MSCSKFLYIATSCPPMVPDNSHCFQRKPKLPSAAHPASLNPSSAKEPSDRARILLQRTNDGETVRQSHGDCLGQSSHTPVWRGCKTPRVQPQLTSPSHQSKTGCVWELPVFLLAPFLFSKQWTFAHQAGKPFPSAKRWLLQRDKPPEFQTSRVTCRAVVKSLKNQIIAWVGFSSTLLLGQCLFVQAGRRKVSPLSAGCQQKRREHVWVGRPGCHG